MKGSGAPTTGIKPVTIPILKKTYKKIKKETPKIKILLVIFSSFKNSLIKIIYPSYNTLAVFFSFSQISHSWILFSMQFVIYFSSHSHFFSQLIFFHSTYFSLNSCTRYFTQLIFSINLFFIFSLISVHAIHSVGAQQNGVFFHFVMLHRHFKDFFFWCTCSMTTCS